MLTDPAIKKFTKLMYYFEDSFSESDIPNHFRLVFDIGFDPDTIKQLEKGVLKNVKGISGAKEILMQFFGVARDAMLVMNAKKLLQNNKLSRILYNNPNYMLNKNMSMLRRIFNDNGKYGHGNTIFNLMEYAFQKTKASEIPELEPKNANQLISDMKYMAGWQTLANEFRKKPVEVNGPRDVANWTYNAIKKLESTADINTRYRWKEIANSLNPKIIENLIKKAILKISNVYDNEAEWVVKNDVLNIPSPSRLFILDENENKSRIAKSNLDDKYKIIWVKPKKFKQLQRKYFINQNKNHESY